MTGFLPRVFRVQRYSIHDGPGIRTTVFFQGCPLACAWCHNPESQPMPGNLTDAAGPGAVASLVPRLMAEIEKDLIFYDESGGGVTFSGGEPLSQPDLVLALADQCREKEIHTCLDTSGFAPWKVLEQAARAVDLILYDIKACDPARHRELTGQSSSLILDNLENLSRVKAAVTLRFPLIPGCTDDQANISSLTDFLVDRTGYRRIHILPFHHTAQGKYRALNQKDPMAGIPVPDNKTIQAAAAHFRRAGFETLIGG